MRVQATQFHAAGAAAPARRATAGTAFSVAGPEPARTTGAGTPPRPVAGLDVLLALQAVDDPVERRRRAISRGRRALDALDALKVALLAGNLDGEALERLRSVAESLSDASGDPGLDAVMAEIGLRAAVEVAKLTRR